MSERGDAVGRVELGEVGIGEVLLGGFVEAPRRVHPDNHDQDDRFGAVAWESYEHRIMWDMVMKANPTSIMTRAQEWAQVAGEVQTALQQARDELARLFGSWEGAGAVAAAAANNQLLEWGNGAASTSHAIAQRVADYAGHVDEVRRTMPEPVHYYAERNFEAGTGATQLAGPSGDYMAAQLADGKAPTLEEMHRRHDEAVAVMRAFEARSVETRTATPSYTDAPVVVPDAAAPPAPWVPPTTAPDTGWPAAPTGSPDGPGPDVLGPLPTDDRLPDRPGPTPAGVGAQAVDLLPGSGPGGPGTGGAGGSTAGGGSGFGGSGGTSGGTVGGGAGGVFGGAGGAPAPGAAAGAGRSVGSATPGTPGAGAAGTAGTAGGAARGGVGGGGMMGGGGRGAGEDDAEHRNKFDRGIDWAADEPVWAPPVIGGTAS